MKRSKQKPPLAPSRLLIWAVMTFVRPAFCKKYGLTIDRTALDGVKPPYVVLFNHVGDDDHLIVGMALYPYLANYMVSRWVLHKFPIGPLSRLAGAIHKARFIPDIDAVLCAKRVVRDRKGIVAIAPAASFSLDGTTHYFDYGIAKLVKLLKVPVFAVRMSGLFPFHNGYREVRNGCLLKCDVIPVFRGDEMADMEVSEIYKRLFVACDFNDAVYAETEHAPVISPKLGLAEGMEYLTYRCLRCGAEFRIRADGNTLCCAACGNRVLVNNRFLLEPTAPDTVWTSSFDRWNAAQKLALLDEIRQPSFCLRERCTLSHHTVGRRYGFTDYGEGEFMLDRSGLVYTGTDMGAEVIYRYPLERTPYMGNFIPYYLSCDSGNDVNRFRLLDMHKAVKFLQALLLMRLLYYPSFPGELEWRMSLPTARAPEIRYGR